LCLLLTFGLPAAAVPGIVVGLALPIIGAPDWAGFVIVGLSYGLLAGRLQYRVAGQSGPKTAGNRDDV
jgi:hypothetical protein